MSNIWLSKASPKKRKLQLDSMQCQNHMSSVEGSASLTNPTQSASSSFKVSDPNKGLYPRKKKKKSHHKDGNNSSDEEIDRFAQTNSSQRTKYLSNNSTNNNQFNSFQPASSLPILESGQNTLYTENPTTSLPKIWNSPSKQGKNTSPQKNNLFNYYSKDKEYKPKLPSVNFNHPIKSENLVNAKPSLSNSLHIGYGSSPETSPQRKPTVTSLAVEISNCQHVANKTIEISSDDDDELGNSSFGMFGLTEVPKVEKKETQEFPIDCLPDHIMEMIFGHLPLQTLLTKVSLVSLRWSDIISNDKFLPWKKKYHKLKQYPKECGKQTYSELLRYTREKKMTNMDSLIFGVVEEMKIFKNKATEDMMSFIEQHPKFAGAKHVVDTHFPKIQVKDYNPFCFIAALVMISETVDDIEQIMKLLLQPNSLCNVNDLLECLYYLATIAYFAVMQFKVAKGLHYRIFYTLYLFENIWLGTAKDITSAFKHSKSGQQSILKYGEGKLRMTNQQMRIINHELQPNQTVKIVAFAGTGKTSTLVEYCKLRPSQRFLNIMFNKSVCDHAKTIFPPNVENRTAHSLAYQGVRVRETYKFAIGSLKPKDLELLDLIGPVKKEKGQSHLTIGRDKYLRCVLTTFETYVNSADEHITLKHVPETFKSKGIQIVISDTDRLNMSNDAETVWKKMIDPNDYTVKMLHDGYLKLHQLRKPRYTGYHCILVDEAQDCNPAMLSIILSQEAPKIFVGDPNQQIYAFRGAVNALDSIQHTHVYYLTQSFRFGPQIAYVANTILYETKNIKSQTLVGGKQKDSITKPGIGQLAILSRANSSLFREAVRMICKRQLRSDEPTDIRGCFNGGTEGIKQLICIYNLMLVSTGKKTIDEAPIKDKFIKRFQSIEHLRAYASNTDDIELRGKLSLVDAYKELIPQYVGKICDQCKFNIKNANVIYSTVHKAKGMEFDTVMLTDDYTIFGFPFKDLPHFDASNQESENELNILYVAVTRAKKVLLMNKAVYFILLSAAERFEYPVFHTDVKTVLCFECDGPITNQQKFVLMRRKLQLSDGFLASSGGPLCQICASNEDYLEENVMHPDDCNPIDPFVQSINDVNRMFLSPLLFSQDL